MVTELQYFQQTVNFFQVNSTYVLIDPINVTVSLSLRAVYGFPQVYALQSWIVMLMLLCRHRGIQSPLLHGLQATRGAEQQHINLSHCLVKYCYRKECEEVEVQFHVFLTSRLDRREWLNSHFSHFSSLKSVPRADCKSNACFRACTYSLY